MPTFENARSPAWAIGAEAAINCEVEHPALGWMPFTATPDDPEPTGAELYARLLAGEFGEITQAVAPAPTPEQLRLYANRKRDAVTIGGFLHLGARFDSDEVSVAKLSGAAIQAQAALLAGASFAITWTDASDGDHLLDAAGMIQLHQALVLHADAAHQVCRQIKADIDAGTITTEAEIDGAAWPG